MPFLSLEEPIERPVARVSRAGGVLISLGAHLLALLLFLFAPGVAVRLLPEPVLDALRSRPPIVTESEVKATPVPPLKPPSPKSQRVPLQFAYVRTPDDNEVDKNPQARLLSDKSRRARQEVQTPPNIKDLSRDPHSKGDTLDQVRPDPRIAEGRDSLERAQPRGGAGTQAAAAAEPTSRETDSAEPDRQGDGKPIENGLDPSDTAGEGNDAAKAARRDDGRGIPIETVPQPGRGGRPKRDTGTGRLSAEARDSLQRALASEGEENKRLFDNPGYLTPGMATGTMSFDTQGFPWGDYGRKIQTIIGNHWDDRLPLAWREGVRGYTCIHFVIQKDGTITDIQVVVPSVVPPFNRAIVDALRASSPLPPLPKDFPEGLEGLTGCYFYNILPQEARDILGE
jgi:TonB family protein